LPDLTASEILAIAKAENLPTRLVFFIESEKEKDDDLTAAIASGACSAISKYASPETLLRFLRPMAEPINALPEPSPDLAPVGKEGDDAKLKKMLAMLTDREREIMGLVSGGLSNKEISRQLNVSQGTVKVHLHNIFQKLEINNRTVLAAIALLQRPVGFGTFSLAALAFATMSDVKASDPNNTFGDDDSIAHKDLDHGVFELWTKWAILQHIAVGDSAETAVLTQRGSISESRVTNSAARMEELHAAQPAVLSNLARDCGVTGSSTPYPFSPPAQSHGGYGIFTMLAAGVWSYTFNNANAHAQALDLGQTLTDTFTVATLDRTTQVVTIHGASDAHSKYFDNLAPGPVVDSHPPFVFGTPGHDSARGNAGQIIYGGGGDDIPNGTGVVDVIYGGSGNDTVKCNGGDDAISGGSGSDTTNGNDTIGGYGGDQLTGSNGEDAFVYLSAIDSNSTRFGTITDFISGADKINLAAFGALAFLHLSPASTSVPPHTLAWTYNPASNETIVYVNPTDGSLDVGDAGLMEIHLQGVVSVAGSDFVYGPDAAAVAAALEGIDPALLVTTASDGTVLTTGSAQAATDAAVSESSPLTADIWAMPADDGLRFHFGRDRIDSIASIKLAVFGDNPAHAAEASDDGAVTAPTHVSSMELAHSHAPVLTEEQLTSREDPPHAGTDATTIGHGKGHAAAGVEPPELGVTAQSAAIASEAAAIVGSSVTTGNGSSQHASNSAAAKAGAADLTEPDGATGNGGSHGSSQHASSSAAAKAAAADLTEPDGATGNGGSRGNSQHAQTRPLQRRQR
jgi:VCBS repeat-containing protein